MDIGIIMGSESDREFVAKAEEVLSDFSIHFETIVCSAHRSAERLGQEIKRMEKEGCQVFIGLAGYAAHLPGVIASQTTLPVLGVPLPTSHLQGVDSLLSIVQMPGGVPVAGLGIGKAGSKNAALLAVQILSLSNKDLSEKWKKYRTELGSK